MLSCVGLVGFGCAVMCCVVLVLLCGVLSCGMCYALGCVWCVGLIALYVGLVVCCAGLGLPCCVALRCVVCCIVLDASGCELGWVAVGREGQELHISVFRHEGHATI